MCWLRTWSSDFDFALLKRLMLICNAAPAVLPGADMAMLMAPFGSDASLLVAGNGPSCLVTAGCQVGMANILYRCTTLHFIQSPLRPTTAQDRSSRFAADRTHISNISPTLL
jgi:hypothetical protein